MRDESKTLEHQKQELLDFTEDVFGKEYFEKLDKLSQDLLIKEEKKLPDFTVTVSYKGAFYASQE